MGPGRISWSCLEGMALSSATRADVRLVVLGGRALYADADYARSVASANHWAAVRVDGEAEDAREGTGHRAVRRDCARAGLGNFRVGLVGGMTTQIIAGRRRHVLLINPTITRRRNAKFPFAVLNLSASLDEKYDSQHH